MSNKRLLLIEDDYDVAEMLLMYFQSHNYEVLHADNGLDGVEMARTRFPNLILLDVMLPNMDGYDVCRKLRATSMTKYIPILFLTQKDERASKVQGLELGADDYITKPFDIDELRLRVQGSIHRATREHLHEARTGLPTGPMIEEETASRQNSGQPYTEFLYAINGFDSFNDVYGFMAGSEVMRHAGQVMQLVIGEIGTPDDFVGIENDTFIVLTHAANTEELNETICHRFNNEVKAFYTFIDVEQNGMTIEEGTGDERVVPLMTLLPVKGPLDPLG
jgi:PleD family two-component response regulator